MFTHLCPYFRKCGGCTAQHIDYSLQMENKKKWIQNALTVKEVVLFSGKEYFYRNRMDLLFTSTGLGLREKGRANKIINVERCVISDERINTLLQEVKQFYLGLDPALRHAFHSLILRAPTPMTGIVFVLKDGSPLESIKRFSTETLADHVVVAYNSGDDPEPSSKLTVIKGDLYLREHFLGNKFCFPITGFFQNNSPMAEQMLAYSRDVLRHYSTSQAHLLDLYGGVGTFGLLNAPLFKSVTIVENSPSSIAAAKLNISQNGVGNAMAYALDAAQLRKIKLESPLFVIADPPRTGMGIKVIQQLNLLQPNLILYVSCNVQQLAKEIPKFKNYQPHRVSLFDLFPQTPHCEVVAELVRKS